MAASREEIVCGRKIKRVKRLKWTRQETIELVSAWKDMSQLFKTFGQRKPFYEEISKKLFLLGHNRSTEQCQTKMNRLKYIYRRFKAGLESYKPSPFCENIEEILNECYMSGDEGSDDCLEGINDALYPALYVQAELKLSPERKEQDDNWDIYEHSSVVSNEGLGSNIEIPYSPPSITHEENDTSDVIQMSKLKSEIWTHNETFTLISEWKKIYESSSLKKRVYEDLAYTLASYGYVRTAEQCQRKMSNLKVKYKKHHRSNGNADWPYYSALHEFLGKQVSKCTTCTRNRINVDDSWTSDETESLISVWKQLNTELENTVIRTPIYEKMSYHLTELGFKRNAEECQQKVIQLKILYRQISYNAIYFDESWPYYDAVHEIMNKSVDKADFASKYTPFLLKKTLLLEYANESNPEMRTPFKEYFSNGTEQILTNNSIENKFPENIQDCSVETDGNINEEDGVINIGRKNVTKHRKILPKSPQEQSTKQDDTFIRLNVEATNQTVPCMESVLLIVPPSSSSSSQSSDFGVSKSPNLVLMPQVTSESLGANLSSNIHGQYLYYSWPIS